MIKKVAYEALSENACNLNMSTWHCGTSHCLAGWATTIAEKGKELEVKYGSYLAGEMLLGKKWSQHFYSDNESVIKLLQAELEKGTS